MSFAFGIAVAAVGLALIYIGWRGLSFTQFWQSLTTGVLPGPGKGANN